jgi:hypothetical protein
MHLFSSGDAVSEQITQQFARELAYLDGLPARGEQLILTHNTASNDGPKQLALFIAARATSAVRAVLHLLRGGLAVECSAPLRTICELLIDVSWIWRDPTQTDGRVTWFVEHDFIVGAQAQSYLDKHLPGLRGPEFLDQTIIGPAPAGVKTMREYHTWRGQYAKQVMDKRRAWEKAHARGRRCWRGGNWAPYSISERAQQTGMKSLYEVVFTSASAAVHSGPTTLSKLVDVQPDGQRLVRVRSHLPTDEELIPVILAAFCFNHLIKFLSGTVFGFPIGEIWEAELSSVFGTPTGANG